MHLKHHAIRASAAIPSSINIHIENYITHYDFILQLEILKKTSQPHQANQTNVKISASSVLPGVEIQGCSNAFLTSPQMCHFSSKSLA